MWERHRTFKFWCVKEYCGILLSDKLGAAKYEWNANDSVGNYNRWVAGNKQEGVCDVQSLKNEK